MKLHRIHISDFFYPCHHRTHFWVHKSNDLSISLGHYGLRQYFEISLGFSRIHLLGQKGQQN